MDDKWLYSSWLLLLVGIGFILVSKEEGYQLAQMWMTYEYSHHVFDQSSFGFISISKDEGYQLAQLWMTNVFGENDFYQSSESGLSQLVRNKVFN